MKQLSLAALLISLLLPGCAIVPYDDPYAGSYGTYTGAPPLTTAYPAYPVPIVPMYGAPPPWYLGPPTLGLGLGFGYHPWRHHYWDRGNWGRRGYPGHHR